ncbi:MAG TPA: glycosyltransferase, partial [Thermomicrobiales bacterium]
MRVGIDVTYAAKREGTGTYIRNLVNALARHPEIEIITFTRPRLAFVRLLPRPFARLTNGLFSIIWLQIAVPIIARQQRLDLFHAPAFLAPLFLPCPLVVTLLDAFQNSLRAQPDRLWSLYLRAFSRLVVNRAHKVLTISHYAAEDLRHFFDLHGDRLVVTPLGVAPDFRHLTEKQTTQLFGNGQLPD